MCAVRRLNLGQGATNLIFRAAPFSGLRGARRHIMVPRGLLSLITETDGGAFFAWAILTTQSVIYSVYLPDSSKSDDLFSDHASVLSASIRLHRARGLKVIVSGDL